MIQVKKTQVKMIRVKMTLAQMVLIRAIPAQELPTQELPAAQAVIQNATPGARRRSMALPDGDITILKAFMYAAPGNS